MGGTSRRWRRGHGVSLLRNPESAQQATYVELFFDLVMVFALNRLVASAVAGMADPGLDASDVGRRWTTLGRTLLLFVPLLWAWTMTAYITARLDPRTPRAQWAILSTGFALLIMGANAPHVFDGGGALAFALAYVVSQVSWFLVFAYLLGTHPLARVYWRVALWFVVSGPLWILGALVPGRWQLSLWILAVVVELGAARLGWPAPGLRHGRSSAWAVAPHHLADRYTQLVLIALGETILAVGITYASGPGRAGGYQTVGLVVSFVTAVLLWRIYFQRAGLVLGEAVAEARDPAALGRFVSFAHAVMILGIVITAIGHELIQLHALGRTYPAWLAVILGGPAFYLVGRAALERAVFSRVSPRRWVGIGVLLVTGLPLINAPPLAAGITAAFVLFGIAMIDTRRAANRPLEAPHPASTRANWSWWRRR
ncbi:low temperature requirement protein A [Micromonospora sp. NPDC047074]|uniref:low temperature requirement protein A n=1 Tax=Micromonospora sp. NPDC047074 TaxID=3154339 RepID=UPI0033E426B7